MKLIVLDRDGVINEHSDQFVKSPEEWIPIPGSLEAIALLTQWGWRVVIATNQSAIGRGLIGMDTLNAIHETMLRRLAEVGGRIHAIFFCPHAEVENCACRKPKPGMLLEIGQRFGADLSQVPAVGDGIRDIQAAVTAGCRPWLVLTGKGRKTLASGLLPENVTIAEDLAEVARRLTESP